LVRQVTCGEIPGVPSAHVIRLSSAGGVYVEGPVAAGGGAVARAAQLLDTLLPSSDAGPQFRVPGGLKLVVSRALGQLDLPPFASLDEFADALARFGATDPAATIANLVVTWAECTAARPAVVVPEGSSVPVTQAQVEPFVALRAPDLAAGHLTISDIRRARRATGLSLSQVSERSRIPVGLLRQLEWGYLRHWPNGHYGRTQLVRYARAAGLDEQIVLSTLTPMLREPQNPAAMVPVPAPRAIVPVIDPPIEVTVTPVDDGAPAAPPRRVRLSSAVAALAIPALLAIGLLPIWWLQTSRAERAAATVAAAPSQSGSAPAQEGQASAPAPPAAAPVTSPEAPPSEAKLDRSDAEPDRVEPQPEQAGAEGAGAEEPAVPARDEEATAYRLAADGVTYSPSFASAGAAMFYHAEADGKASLMRADTDSRGAVLRITSIVDDNANNFHVRPSPDGSRIAFDSDRDGVRGVYVADADGKNVRRVSPAGFAAVPSWSHDGKRLAFVRAEPSAKPVDPLRSAWNLWTLDLESGALQQVTRHKYGQPWGGSWFPDNQRIAYSHETRLVIHDLNTGQERVFRTPKPGRLLRTPAVSPDGQRVIFQVFKDGGWLLELKNGSMRRVLEDPSAEEYTWSPDGRQVAYHSRKAGTWGVWMMAPR
jgi:Tol biopolymer transport system component